MNKILPYIAIAILLGTVTMVVPYALLGPSDYTSLTEESTLIQPSPAETEQPSAPTESPAPKPVPSPTEPATETEKLDSQERAYTEGGDLLNGDSLTPVPSAPTEPPTPVPTPAPAEPRPVPSPVPEPSEPEPQEPKAEAPEPAVSETALITESLSNLSPIGLMTIPSFLIALGAFIYLKKRRS